MQESSNQTRKNLQACKQCLRTYFADNVDIFGSEKRIIFYLFLYNNNDCGLLIIVELIVFVFVDFGFWIQILNADYGLLFADL